MPSKPKLPAELYVVAKKQPIYDSGKIIGFDNPLGFLNAYEPGKASFDKKRITQEDWAYREYVQSFALVKRGSASAPEWWITGVEYEPWVPGMKARGTIPVDKFADPQPAVWVNDPIPGFKIMNSVSRYSTSNKLWRILDPRGYEFEISTACLEQIIEDAGISKGGEINAKCAWMSNKNLVVVP